DEKQGKPGHQATGTFVLHGKFLKVGRLTATLATVRTRGFASGRGSGISQVDKQARSLGS
ncbi:hypothetical protein, partial [Rahnella aceris]